MNTWRNDKPVPHHYVYVWGNGTDTVPAYWTGKCWRNEAGKIVHDVTHWRENEPCHPGYKPCYPGCRGERV